MNVEHLRLFIRLASTQKISPAGQYIGVSPAVASAHICKLEDALSVRLVHRITRRVSLAEEGETFLPHAEEMLASVEAARASVGAGSTTLRQRRQISPVRWALNAHKTTEAPSLVLP